MNQPEKFSNPDVSAFLAQGGFIELGGHSIFRFSAASVNADAPTILLIHGFPTSSWDWHKIIQALVQVADVEAIDMLGFGFSDKPNKRNYTIHRQADLHQDLLAQQQANEVHILAHDYGVSVAQELLARQHQDGIDLGIKSCCFLNGGLFPETHRALLIQKLLLSPLGPFLNRFLAFNKFKASFSHVFGAATQPSDQELRDFWEIINFKDGKHLFHNLITYMRDRKTHRDRWLTCLQQSKIPLALINGSDDPVSGQHLVARYQALACRLDYVKELSNIGHYPQVEDPSAVAQSYLEFLAMAQAR